MNRHDRRAAKAKADRGTAPELDPTKRDSYEKTAQAMLELLRRWLGANMPPPAFRLPPRDVALLAPLDMVGHTLARDNAAHSFVDAFCEVGVDVGGEPPTVMQLQAVLELAGVPVERVSLAELGLQVATVSRGTVGRA